MQYGYESYRVALGAGPQREGGWSVYVVCWSKSLSTENLDHGFDGKFIE